MSVLLIRNAPPIWPTRSCSPKSPNPSCFEITSKSFPSSCNSSRIPPHQSKDRPESVWHRGGGSNCSVIPVLCAADFRPTAPEEELYRHASETWPLDRGLTYSGISVTSFGHLGGLKRRVVGGDKAAVLGESAGMAASVRSYATRRRILLSS